MLHRMLHNFKLVNCLFLEFNHFGPRSTTGHRNNEAQKPQLRDHCLSPPTAGRSRLGWAAQRECRWGMPGAGRCTPTWRVRGASRPSTWKGSPTSSTEVPRTLRSGGKWVRRWEWGVCFVPISCSWKNSLSPALPPSNDKVCSQNSTAADSLWTPGHLNHANTP